MPPVVKINVAQREQNCQKIGSERVNSHMGFIFVLQNFPQKKVISALKI